MRSCCFSQVLSLFSVSRCWRSWIVRLLAGLGALLVANPSLAQNVAPDDPPAVLVPKQPPTQKELDRRESLYKYVPACASKRRAPGGGVASVSGSGPARSGGGPCLQGPGADLARHERPPDALTAINKVVELDPADTDAWYIQGRIFRMLGQKRPRPVPPCKRAWPRTGPRSSPNLPIK